MEVWDIQKQQQEVAADVTELHCHSHVGQQLWLENSAKRQH